MSPAAVDPPPVANLSGSDSLVTRLPHLRGVRWRINLCNFRSSSIDDLRRFTADYRRRYAILRRRLLIDPHIRKDGSTSVDRVMDNPLSENPDSMWGRFFRNAELEKMLDQDLSRLYPEHGSYFQTSGCQSMLRRILLLWCLRHPEYGYRQGMHELVAPLLYVLHGDLQYLSEARKLYEDHFTDKFDDALFQENDLAYNFDLKKTPDFVEDDSGFQEKTKRAVSLDELDPEIQTIILLSDAYGAEGELGVVLSEKFMEHDVYCMFDALMSGMGGAVAMAEFFSPSTGDGSQNGVAPVIEASSALYHLLSVVDSSLYSHLVELGVEPQYFALRWLRVLFGREFSLENLLIIWDEVFSFDNAKLGTFNEVEPGSSVGVLNSRRGAFISALAVSMILNLRSSLLATEIATSCLQRLLNFAGSIKLDKLIWKAKSILDLALDINVSSSYAVPGFYDQKKSSASRSHSLSFDSASTMNPLISVPDSYWEEKWRDLQKEELKKEKNAVKEPSIPRRGWTEKIKMRLSWSGSEPSFSPSKRDGRKEHRSVRRNLLQDLSRALGEEFDDIEDNDSINQNDPFHDESIGDNESLNQNGPFHDEIVRVHDVHGKLGGIEKTFSGQSTVTEENSTVFSDPESPSRGSNSLENDSEKSSVASCVSHEMNEESHHIDPFHSVSADRPTFPEKKTINSEEQSSTSDPSDASVSVMSDSPDLAATASSKDKKSLSGKFQWLWKLGRHASGEGPSDKDKAQVIKSTNEESQRSTVVGQSSPAEEQSCSSVNVKGDVAEQNLMCTLRNLGQSMLENIQVIESVFQQDLRQAGSLDNLSKSALVEKGQVRAVSAIKELRKISNLLSEM